MATPGAPNPYGPPGTVGMHYDGTQMTADRRLAERHDRLDAIARGANEGRRNLKSDFEGAFTGRSSAPSTPRRGGTRRRRRTKYGGAQSAPRTPEQPARPIVVPGRPTRPIRPTNPTGNLQPRRLSFPPEVQPNGQSRPSQGGASLKCGTHEVRQTDARGKAYCARCGRNHVKMWDRRANTYYCGFDPEAYDKRIKATRGRSRRVGGKKTKRAKRSSKKTRRTHKKRRTHRKRR